METLTITEALAEIKMIEKRIAKKREFIINHAYRQNHLKDPLEKDGGQTKVIQQEAQSIDDLYERVIKIRRAIQNKNAEIELAVQDETRTIADWLVWRREIAPLKKEFLTGLEKRIVNARKEAASHQLAVKKPDEEATSLDIIVNIDEFVVHETGENLLAVLETLDGQLSKLNALTAIEI
jgi:hypothetical protein